MLLTAAAVAVVVILVVVAAVVLREVNRTTEVEAAPGYSAPEATEFVITALSDEAKRRLRRSEVERVVGYCLGLLERGGVALTARRPRGDELEGNDLVLDADGVARALTDEVPIDMDPADRTAVAVAFLQYLEAIGAVGGEADAAP